MKGTGIFRTLGISAAGLSIQRMKLDVIAENLANVETTRTAQGGPYKRKQVSISTSPETRSAAVPFSGYLKQFPVDRFAGNVSTANSAPPAEIPQGQIESDEKTPFTLRYDPGHPDANENGVVSMPNVNVIDEMVDMITATRAYEANINAIQSAKDMFLKALEI